jgi:uncharacterized protein
MKFEFKSISKKKLVKPILIEGLPGIGNVGKIAIDFLVENIKAKPLVEIYSNYFPHSVFINEQNLIDLPVLTIHHKKVNGQDFLFLVGDVQPIDEVSCYDFCKEILDFLSKHGGSEVITLGGIGLQKIPKKPKVYITGTDKKYVKSFPKADNKIYGVVGPILGVTGVLLGQAQRRGMLAAGLLTQTFAHPAYLGIKGAKETLRVLNKKYDLGVDLAKLSDEIDEIEKEVLTRSKRIAESSSNTRPNEPNYFG